MRKMTLRCFWMLVFTSGWMISHAQLYRVFYKECTNPEYERILAGKCDSVWMTSHWLNYSLVNGPHCLHDIEHLDFVDHVVEVEQDVSSHVTGVQDASRPNPDPHRQWQLDTMGYRYFNSQGIDGKGIRIAIIDAGFTGAEKSRGFETIFREGRVLRTWDFIDNDTTVFDGSTHGTGVWGCIAGNLDGKPTGLAPGASFFLLRSEDQKTETLADEDRWILAIEKAYEWGADIVTSSIGFTSQLHKKDEVNGGSLISQAASIAAEKGMIVIISAGNEFISTWKTLSVPGDAKNVITVGAIDRTGSQSYFSSVGPTFDGRSKPDVVAPGTCVTINGNSFVTVSGTSFATPLVAGYVACMLQMKGKKNWATDSIKKYGGLYPYFDCVYGYGVPRPFITEHSGGLDGLSVEKQKPALLRNGNGTGGDICFVKIEGINGEIKYASRLDLKGKDTFKLPVTRKKNPFSYRKYYSPDVTDTWTIWWKGGVLIF